MGQHRCQISAPRSPRPAAAGCRCARAAADERDRAPVTPQRSPPPSQHSPRLPPRAASGAAGLGGGGEEGAGPRLSVSLPRVLLGNMAGVEEAAASGSHLNGDLDPDDREEGASSTAEEAAKKKRRKKKKSKGTAAGKRSLMFAVPARNGRTTWLRPGRGGRNRGPGLIPRPEKVSGAGYGFPDLRRGGFSPCGTPPPGLGDGMCGVGENRASEPRVWRWGC
jgi:hypothetical protein